MASLVFFFVLTLIGHAKSAKIFTLDLVDGTRSHEKYSEFLEKIRQDVLDPNLHYGETLLPVIGPPSETYLRVDLLLSVGIVSLGVSRDNLYLLFYKAKNEMGIEKVYYFHKEVKPTNVKELFPEVRPENYFKLGYSEQYDSLEHVAGSERQKIGLGINKLVQYAEKVYSKTRDPAVEASFLLVSLQMVSEATRFRYLENAVVSKFPYGFTPKDKVLILEKNWGKISKKIKESTGGRFAKEFTINCMDCPGIDWVVYTIEELEMGILKFCSEEDKHDGSAKRKEKSVKYRKDFNEGLQRLSRGEQAARKDHTSDILPGNIRGKYNGRNDGSRSRSMSSQDPIPLDFPIPTVEDIFMAILMAPAIYLKSLRRFLGRRVSTSKMQRQMKASRKKAYRRLLRRRSLEVQNSSKQQGRDRL